jgi:hypothetical protein
MQTLDRLRSGTRRAGILLWMLLAAYVCAPLASAMQPTAHTVVVPFCAAQGVVAGHQAPVPRSIALHFADPHAGASGCPALPAPRQSSLRPRVPETRVVPEPRTAPKAVSVTRLPPSRAPPAPATPS